MQTIRDKLQWQNASAILGGGCGNIIVMDTLAVSEKLIAVGVPKPEAHAHAQILSEVTDDLKDELVTKADLNAALSATKGELKVALAEMESRMTWRIVSAMVALTAIFSVMLVVVQMWAGG